MYRIKSYESLMNTPDVIIHWGNTSYFVSYPDRDCTTFHNALHRSRCSLTSATVMELLHYSFSDGVKNMIFIEEEVNLFFRKG